MAAKPIAAVLSLVNRDLAAVEAVLSRAAEADEPLMRQLLGMVLPGGGKRLRPILSLLAGRLNRYTPERLVSFAASLEMLHTATLIHDDIVDEARVRRGDPTLNTRVNNSIAVLVGDYMFAQSAAHVAATGHLGVITSFAQSSMTVIGGQIDESWADGGVNLTREQYMRRIGSKTAALFALAGQGGAMLSEATEEMIEALNRFGYLLGLAFQIVDDILDVVGDERTLGKPVGSDIRQGTVTLPAILVREQLSPQLFQAAFLGDGHRDEPVQKLLEAIRNGGGIDGSYLEAERLVADARKSLDVLPAGEVKDALLELAGFVVQRVA